MATIASDVCEKPLSPSFEHGTATSAGAQAKYAQQLALAAEQDLVASGQPDRNWRGIIIAVLVISAVLALIVTSVVLLTPPDEGPRVKGRRFELDDIFGPDFQPYRLNGTWISDHEWIYRDPSGGVSLFDASNSSIRQVISNHTFVHRHSYTARYTLFEIETGETKPVSLGSHVATHHTDRDSAYSRIQLVKWAPAGHAFILVHEGDIYYYPNPKQNRTYRITTSAQPGIIYNGIPDWLYEEEIFGSNSALWFSSDGRSLLYLTFNDSLVGEHYILQYGTLDDPYVYPKVRSLRYPKPGTSNPTVRATVVDLSDSTFRSKSLLPPEGISNQDHYVTSAGWIKNKDVGIIWTSRPYNLSIISVCPKTNGICDEVYRVTTEKRGWVENIPFPVFSHRENGKHFITIAPVRDGENGFFDHLVLVDMINRRSHPITYGSYDVIKVNAWDEERKLVYFTAIPSSNPSERRLLQLKLEQPFTDHTPICLSCGHGDSKNGTVSSTTTGIIGDGVTSKKGSRKPSQQAGPILTTSQEEQKHQAGHGVVKDGAAKPGSSKARHPPSRANRSNITGEELEGSNQIARDKSCTFVSNVKFSKSSSYFVLECAGPDVPFVLMCSSKEKVGEKSTTPMPLYVQDRDIRDRDGIENSLMTGLFPGVEEEPHSSTPNLNVLEILQNNDALLALTRTMAFPQVRTFAVHTMGGHTVQVRYGGPGTQLAIDRWGVDFATYLAGKKDYIVAQIDGRGSGGRGWGFQHQIYYRIGLLEVADQIEVIRFLRDSLHFVEPKKIGVWGWSYGGFLTAMIMASKESTDVFQCGASVAPVSSWRMYDSAYTERYMGKPNVTDNYKGYAESDVTKNVEQFANKMFYLVHGTADDNVHLQHSMLLAKALIEKNILFRQQLYPDESHGLNGVKKHVHKSLENFFEDCFRKQSPPEMGTGLNKGGNIEEFPE
ncbi:Inactive dipeptidyl peptidase 10 [Orchesella cincta]|uniref:Venom dipeptidyl peptidase 4 n=1 Tax=Orchesella cincta TaxID=48709 RepID=A0A1D2MHC3_ORCCI|nr:Inactive dipeptidyl peptidase 10 [Orchesella cincta]